MTVQLTLIQSHKKRFYGFHKTDEGQEGFILESVSRDTEWFFFPGLILHMIQQVVIKPDPNVTV